MKRYTLQLIKPTVFFWMIGLALTGSAFSQDSRVTELFGGYSFIETDPGIDGLDSFGSNGVHVEVSRFFSQKFGVGLELSSHFGSTSMVAEGPHDLSSTQYSLLIGPRLNSLSFWRIRLSTRALFGFSTVDLDVEQADEMNSIPASLEDTQTDFAIALGASIDVELSERISLRLIQSNRFFTFFGDGTQSNTRYSSGILVHF